MCVGNAITFKLLHYNNSYNVQRYVVPRIMHVGLFKIRYNEKGEGRS